MSICLIYWSTKQFFWLLCFFLRIALYMMLDVRVSFYLQRHIVIVHTIHLLVGVFLDGYHLHGK